MKQVLIKKGQIIVEDVPAPIAEPKTVLVQVDHSCISVGTEISGITSSGIPLWKRALNQPKKAKKAISMAIQNGMARTFDMVKDQLETPQPIGYSAAGTVIDVGEGSAPFKPGDKVACAGLQYVHHAEIIRVPVNLTAKIPKGVDFKTASTVALGAIALQGVRRANPTLGETFGVIGLGFLGQLTVQILSANGVRVIGIDIDPSRVQLACELGMKIGLGIDRAGDIDAVMRITDGIGADGVIITAASASDGIISDAFSMCRKKGRVVLVGDVGLNLKREDMYTKELDFFVSTSYGPGRYDIGYEDKGIDYPLAYVRWTENRNMVAYLLLLADGKLKITPLLQEIFPLERAQEAYHALKGKQTPPPLAALIAYNRPEKESYGSKVVYSSRTVPSGSGSIRVALIGAGEFAKRTHLPSLKALSNLYDLHAVVSRTGHNAGITAQKFGADYATTDFQKVLEDPDIDAVLITTRHDLHASMTLQALKAGKHVFVEKPIALTPLELDEIKSFYASDTSNDNLPLLMTGYNRRFSKYSRSIFEKIKARSNPMMIHYRMNAGYIPLDHWVHNVEGGGRNLGEACHIYDLFIFLTDSRVASVSVKAIHPHTGYYSRFDNFIATMAFEDGSIASLIYSSLGSTAYPKELLEIYCDGLILGIDDYKRLIGTTKKQSKIKSRTMEKGHKEILIEFARAIKNGGEWPIPFWQQVHSAEIAFQVDEQLKGEKNG